MHRRVRWASRSSSTTSWGAGNIGNQSVAARPDGYTLLVAYSGYQVGNPHLFAKAGWDPHHDFTPWRCSRARRRSWSVTRADLAGRHAGRTGGLARANPGKLNYASSATGRSSTSPANRSQLTGTFITHNILYRGAGPGAGPDGRPGGPVHHHAGGQQVKGWCWKALAVTSPTRPAALAGATAVEAGPKAGQPDSWFALLIRAGRRPTWQTPSTEVGKILSQFGGAAQGRGVGHRGRADEPGTAGPSSRKELDHRGRVTGRRRSPPNKPAPAAPLCCVVSPKSPHGSDPQGWPRRAVLGDACVDGALSKVTFSSNRCRSW